MKNLNLFSSHLFCLFALIIFIFGGCKDDANPTTTGGPSANSVTLLTPADDTTIVRITGGQTLFSWSATGTPNHYFVQGEYQDTVFNPYSGGIVTTNSFTINHSNWMPGWYIWRVWAVYGSDSVVSPTWLYTVQ
jgi:hypothetical protein